MIKTSIPTVSSKFISIAATFLLCCMTYSVFAEDIIVHENDHQNRIIIRDNIGITGDSYLFFGDALTHYISWDESNSTFVFSDDVSFDHNQITNVRLENISTAPLCNSSFSGKIYHNTSDSLSYVCNGSLWKQIDNETVTGTKLQPYFESITPKKIAFNTTEDIIITGGNFDEDTAFFLGSGVTVNSITINSDKQATINVTSGGTEILSIPVDAKNDTLDDFGELITFDVVAENWQLFAISSSSQCAENLPYGTNAITEASSAYFTTALQNEIHTEFKQVFTVNGNTLFEINYDFGNSKTLKDRMNNAYQNGENVTWTVTHGANTYSYGPYKWYYSDGANLATKWTGSGTRFANDDGSWGAANSNVDGNGGPYETWGHGNHNSSDATCSTYYTNGAASSTGTIKSYMYLQ